MSETVTPHPFEAWLDADRRTKEWAAALLKLSRGTLHRYLRGARLMDPATKFEVQVITGGAVQAIEICRWELERARQQLQDAA